MRCVPDRFTIPIRKFEPAYVALSRSGELRLRAEEAIGRLKACCMCPRNCGADRLSDKTGFCKTGRYALVSSYFAHKGEEDCIRGRRGSGTIFFSNCNLGCVFCQNYEISQMGEGAACTADQIADMMLSLQEDGCHNINFVTPEHVVPQMLEALVIAAERGLRLPIVYNTSAYDSAESLRFLDGVVDIYMPDFKFWDSALSLKYLRAEDYPESARYALMEMYRQVGELKFDENGIALRGVLVRHLLMPGCVEDTKAIMRFLADLSKDTYINLLTQYHPSNMVSAGNFPEINRRVTLDEYNTALEYAKQLGLYRFD